MQTSWKFAALVLLECYIPFVACQNPQLIDLEIVPSVGTTSLKGEKFQVYELEGIQFAQPRIGFDGACAYLKYNRLYQKYQITFPLKIDSNTLGTPTDSLKKFSSVNVTGINVLADSDLMGKNSPVRVKVQLQDNTKAMLLLMCESFLTCRELQEDIDANPAELTEAVSFVVWGRIGSNVVKFAAARSLSLPSFHCQRRQWVVFQQRVDGNLSFAQTWDAYEKGFGSPGSNYWMGLRLLSASTVTGSLPGAYMSRCELRIETEDYRSRSYWAEYKFFQVLGPEENYKLRLSGYVSGSTIPNSPIEYHNEAAFSTLDRDHDTAAASCSRAFGYGGWWFKSCGQWHLNSAYPYSSTVTIEEAFMGIILDGRIAMKSSKMMFKCN